MIDLKILRTEPDRVRETLRRRGSNLDLDEIVALDASYRELLGDVEALRAAQNRASRHVAATAGDEREVAIREGRRLSSELKEKESALQDARARVDQALSYIPNLIHPEVPEGLTEDENIVVREVGRRLDFDFQPLDHLEIGESLGLIDSERAARVSGSRFAYLMGAAVWLELALVRLAFERLSAEGFTPVIPPVLVRQEALFGTGFFPGDEAQVYKTESDDLYLAGTSEVPLAGIHSGETLSPDELPKRYAGFSTCFRREAGTYGKDTRGIIRVHQFDKVEMFSYCSPESSEEEHQRLVAIEESILQALEIPYRVVEMCAGDLSSANYRRYDLDGWLPGEGRWLELMSCSNCTDYQARRLGVRTKRDGSNVPVHMLNGTAVAVQRTIVALLENHQQPDGSVRIPEALRTYTGFDSIP